MERTAGHPVRIVSAALGRCLRSRPGRASLVAAIAALALTAGCTTGQETTGSEAASTSKTLKGNVSTEALHDNAVKAARNATLAFAPAGLGLTLPDEWETQIRAYAKAYGFKYLLRESDWDTKKQANVLQSLVNQLEPGDVLVVHNATVSLLAKTIERAERKGIHVIQLNMASNYKSDAYVATDSIAVGRSIARDVLDVCGKGTSGKVAVVQGDLTSEVALDTMLGWNSVMKKHKRIKLVSKQSAAWDPTKAHDIMANVLQKHPDLCAVWGQFDEMDQGSAQAIREANLTGKLPLFTYGGSPITCKLVAKGEFTKAYSFQASQVGSLTAALAFYLVQAAKEPGSSRTGMFIPTFVIDKSNAKDPNVCYDGKGSGTPVLQPIG